MNEFTEVEFKYKSDNTKLTDFQKLMEKIGFIKKLDVSSWDQYFTLGEDSFLRLRLSETPELTSKFKTKESNNVVRKEIDVPLDFKRLKENTIEEFAKMLGYTKATRLFKSCFVYWQDKINFVFYCVYDTDLNELGRFLEIECNKGSGATYEDLLKAEKQLAEIGITPQNRMKKSLYELYVKT